MSTNPAYPLVDRLITVKLNGKDEKVTVSIAEVPVSVVVKHKGRKVHNENTFTESIAQNKGEIRDVMVDTYRSLIDSNLVHYKGPGGHAKAKQAAKEGFADRNTLPNFKNQTDGFNAAGALVWNLLFHSESQKRGYRIMGAILCALLAEGFDAPRMDSVPRNAKLAQTKLVANNGKTDGAPLPTLTEVTQSSTGSLQPTPEENEPSSYIQDSDADPEYDYQPHYKDLRETAMQQIKKRRGQQQFRDALLALYGNTCPITGCKVVAALEAAHIIPHRSENDNNPQNGLLLRADVHTLFDLNLIGIEPKTFRIHLHPSIEKDMAYSRQLQVGRSAPMLVKASADALQYRWKQFLQRKGQPA